MTDVATSSSPLFAAVGAISTISDTELEHPSVELARIVVEFEFDDLELSSRRKLTNGGSKSLIEYNMKQLSCVEMLHRLVHIFPIPVLIHLAFSSVVPMSLQWYDSGINGWEPVACGKASHEERFMRHHHKQLQEPVAEVMALIAISVMTEDDAIKAVLNNYKESMVDRLDRRTVIDQMVLDAVNNHPYFPLASGKDEGLIRDVIDNHLDDLIGGEKLKINGFSTAGGRSAGNGSSALRDELDKLPNQSLKAELSMLFAEYGCMLDNRLPFAGNSYRDPRLASHPSATLPLPSSSSSSSGPTSAPYERQISLMFPAPAYWILMLVVRVAAIVPASELPSIVVLNVLQYLTDTFIGTMKENLWLSMPGFPSTSTDLYQMSEERRFYRCSIHDLTNALVASDMSNIGATQLRPGGVSSRMADVYHYIKALARTDEWGTDHRTARRTEVRDLFEIAQRPLLHLLAHWKPNMDFAATILLSDKELMQQFTSALLKGPSRAVYAVGRMLARCLTWSESLLCATPPTQLLSALGSSSTIVDQNLYFEMMWQRHVFLNTVIDDTAPPIATRFMRMEMTVVFEKYRSAFVNRFKSTKVVLLSSDWEVAYVMQRQTASPLSSSSSPDPGRITLATILKSQMRGEEETTTWRNEAHEALLAAKQPPNMLPTPITQMYQPSATALNEWIADQLLRQTIVPTRIYRNRKFPRVFACIIRMIEDRTNKLRADDQLTKIYKASNLYTRCPPAYGDSHIDELLDRTDSESLGKLVNMALGLDIVTTFAKFHGIDKTIYEMYIMSINAKAAATSIQASMDLQVNWAIGGYFQHSQIEIVTLGPPCKANVSSTVANERALALINYNEQYSIDRYMLIWFAEKFGIRFCVLDVLGQRVDRIDPAVPSNGQPTFVIIKHTHILENHSVVVDWYDTQSDNNVQGKWK